MSWCMRRDDTLFHPNQSHVYWSIHFQNSIETTLFLVAASPQNSTHFISLSSSVTSINNNKTSSKMQEIGKTETWLRKHRLVYNSATKHPFILSIRDGTVQSHSFKTWLAQDYLFVREFVPFVASVLIQACKESDESDDVEVILGGIASLNDELSWFKREANKWDIQLSEVVPQKANKDYCRLLGGLMSSDVGYSVALTAFWAIEVVYQESFASCVEEGSKTPKELKETCERWGNEGFGQYCQTLQKMVDRRLLKASDEEVKKAEVVFLSIVEHEVEFWNMSSGN